eukprot:Sdes_comp20806_c0_seq1m17147
MEPCPWIGFPFPQATLRDALRLQFWAPSPRFHRPPLRGSLGSLPRFSPRIRIFLREFYGAGLFPSPFLVFVWAVITFWMSFSASSLPPPNPCFSPFTAFPFLSITCLLGFNTWYGVDDGCRVSTGVVQPRDSRYHMVEFAVEERELSLVHLLLLYYSRFSPFSDQHRRPPTC